MTVSLLLLTIVAAAFAAHGDLNRHHGHKNHRHGPTEEVDLKYRGYHDNGDRGREKVLYQKQKLADVYVNHNDPLDDDDSGDVARDKSIHSYHGRRYPDEEYFQDGRVLPYHFLRRPLVVGREAAAQ